MKLLLALVLFLSSAEYVNAQIKVHFSNMKPVPSTLYIGIYSESDVFLSDIFTYGKELKVRDAEITWLLEDLPPGKYAVTAYQDVNNNGKMDKGMMGMPKEPFGFSNNPSIGFKGPSFEAASFIFTGEEIYLEVRMR